MDHTDESRNKIKPGVAPCPDAATLRHGASLLEHSIRRGDFDEEFEEIAASASRQFSSVAEMTEEAVRDDASTSSIRAVTLEGLDALLESMDREDFDEVASVLGSDTESSGGLKMLLEWMEDA